MASDPSISRQIRIFISSTFEDMQQERNELVTKTFPVLRETAERRNVSITEIDLRWGVTKEEAQNGSTIDICLQEIDNAHPFFIGIVGNRYGWRPTPKEIRDIDALERKFPGVHEDLHNGLSVTEMELQYGVLRREEKTNAIFFIKEPFSPSEKDPVPVANLSHLRRQIEENGRYPVFRYRSPEEIGIRVHDEFLRLLNEVFPEEDSSPDRMNQLCQEAFIDSQTRGFIPTPEGLAAIDSFLQSEEDSALMVIGESGIGKSALTANWIHLRSRTCGWEVFYHFVGESNDNCDYASMCRAITYQAGLNPNLDSPHYRNPSPFSLLEILAQRPGKKLLIVDGADHLLGPTANYILQWPSWGSASFKMVFTLSSESQQEEALYSLGVPSFELCPPDPDVRAALIRNYFQHFSKALTPEQLSRITAAPSARNTFFLKLILEDLRAFGDFWHLDEYIDHLVQPASISEFLDGFLERAEGKFGIQAIRDVLSFIEVSRAGLTETEIRDLTGLAPIQWSQLYCFLDPFLSRRAEGLMISNRHLRSAIEDRYLDKFDDEGRYRKRLLGYISGKRNDRALMERAHQYYLLEDSPGLLSVLSEIWQFETLLRNDPFRLARYWKTVSADTGQTPAVYLSRIEELSTPKEKVRACLLLSRFLYGELSDTENAITFAAKAKEICLEDGPTQFPRLLANANYNLGLFLRQAGRKEDALDCFQQILDAEERAPGMGCPPELLGPVFQAIALLLTDLDSSSSSADAVDLLKRAMAYNKAAFSDHSEQYILSCSALATTYDNLGQDAEAKALFEEALALAVETYGKDGAVYAHCCSNIGYYYLLRHDPDSAIDFLGQSISIRERLFGEDHRDLGTPLLNITEAYRQKGDYVSAFKNIHRAAGILRNHFGEGLETASAYKLMGTLCTDCRRPAEGVSFHVQAIEIIIREKGESSPLIIDYYSELARSLYEAGEKEHCLDVNRRMLSLLQANPDADPEVVDIIRNNITTISGQLASPERKI